MNRITRVEKPEGRPTFVYCDAKMMRAVTLYHELQAVRLPLVDG